MVVLEFVIIVFVEGSEKTVIEVISDCEVAIVDWQVLSEEVTPQFAKKPDFRQGAAKLHFRVETFNTFLDLHEAYTQLSMKWIDVTSNFEPYNCRPWLIFQSVVAFPRVWDATTLDIPVERLSLGTVPWSSAFVGHFKSPDTFQGTTANFYHDFKTVDVFFNKFNKITFSYANIRRIFVKHNVVSQSVEIYLILVNPPLVYSGKGHPIRVMTLPPWFSLLPAVLGKSTAIRLVLKNCVAAHKIVARLHFRSGRMPVCHVAMVDQEMDPNLLPNDDVVLPDFLCTYLLKALVDRNYVFQIQNCSIWNYVMSFVAQLAANDPENLQKTLADMLRLLDDGVVENYCYVLKQLFKYHREVTEDRTLTMPSRTRLVTHVVITPTRTLLFPPEIMNSNRVLRNFDVDYALRVSFREDNLTKLNLKASNCSPKIFHEVVFQPMIKGLFIGNRHYEFLGWSNSQLRDHGVWMYARDAKGNTVWSIRKWMGDFSKILSVPKFMARMGQCFSQTQPTVQVPLDESHVITVPDIVDGVNPTTGEPYCFSDGVGQMSTALAEEVCRILELPANKSAFQIRYAGYKGMLVLNPKLKDVDIVFRESMLKFQCSEANSLEIVKVSNPVGVYLNRQLITVLDHMEIAPRVFLKLQEEQLRTITDMLVDEDIAVRQLAINCPLPEMDYFELTGSGIGLTTEPFFRSMLLALHRTSVKGLKTKARIAINPDYGRYMFGVLDETATLHYGEVFVQYSTNLMGNGRGSSTIVHEGWVLVTKNPCLQPGDVRVLMAVDVPELHHIVDAIVFPQKGQRPHPDEMSGSDLDGDEYSVIWYKELIFQRGNEPAENYPSPHEYFLNRPIEVKDMIEFLVKFICNDQVGVLGNAHLALADNKHYGLGSQACSRIAHKFSLAVDFAKNGHRVQLLHHEKIQHYPDFMEKEGRATNYRSRRTLGKLYRVCRDFEYPQPSAGVYYGSVQVDPHLVYPGWTDYQINAKSKCDKYNRHLESILSTYGVIHESEAMAAAFSQLHSRLQERRDRPEVEEIIIRSIRTLWTNMRKEFWEEFAETPFQELYERVLRKASAWYMVTYSLDEPKYLSFPWIVAKILAAVKIVQMSPQSSCNSSNKPFIDVLDNYLAKERNQLIPLIPSLMEIIANAKLSIPYATVELSTQLVLKWAWYQKLVHSIFPAAHLEKRNYIPLSSLVLLFLHVVQICPAPHTPMGLFIEFLRFCTTLRFLSQAEAQEVLPFKMHKTKYLGKVAMSTYHCIAMEGSLACAGFIETKEVTEEEMEPVRLPLMLNGMMRYNDFQVMKRLLQEWTGVSVVHVREGWQSAIISAAGNRDSLKHLRSLLQKDITTLQIALETGILDV